MSVWNVEERDDGILTGTGSQLLERAIGRSRALDFLLRSRQLS